MTVNTACLGYEYNNDKYISKLHGSRMAFAVFLGLHIVRGSKNKNDSKINLLFEAKFGNEWRRSMGLDQALANMTGRCMIKDRRIRSKRRHSFPHFASK